jgi:hypothetical protein
MAEPGWFMRLMVLGMLFTSLSFECIANILCRSSRCLLQRLLCLLPSIPTHRPSIRRLSRRRGSHHLYVIQVQCLKNSANSFIQTPEKSKTSTPAVYPNGRRW